MKRLLIVAGLCLAAVPARADTGRDMLKTCNRSASMCGAYWQSDELTPVWKERACAPAAEARQKPILDWLADHPKTAKLELVRAVRLAQAALWPCR